jgi:hypothetical protein
MPISNNKPKIHKACILEVFAMNTLIIYVWQTLDTWTRFKAFILIPEHSVLVPSFTSLTFLSSCMWTTELRSSTGGEMSDDEVAVRSEFAV